jgi:hypothetical protein
MADRFERDWGNGMKYEAFSTRLDPVGKRKTPDANASLCRWMMRLPGQHPLWSRYVLTMAHLRDIPGVPPAKKVFRDATHEIIVAAIDPDYPDEHFKLGGVAMLEPINYAKQIQARSDQHALAVVENLASMCVERKLLAEFQGIRGHKELWDSTVDQLVTDC